MLIDCHAHLNDERLLPEVDSIVNDMERDNLYAIVNAGCDRESSEICYELSKKYPSLYCVVGFHPEEAAKATKDDYEYFAKISADDKVLAIGEIGLDYYYECCSREKQTEVFMEQLDLAYSLKLPAVIHLRDAYGVMLDLIKKNVGLLKYGALLHCYSGSKEMMQEFDKLGLYFSFGGSVTFKNAVDKPSIIRATPRNKILLETDCPYLTPAPFRGKTNYPKYVNYVAEKVADVLETDKETVSKLTMANAKEFFKKIK